MSRNRDELAEQNFGPVRILPGPNRGRYPYCHSLYIEGAGVLIDPASDRERLIRLREEEGVREVWLSHWHEDHFLHLDLFDDLPLCMSRADAPPLADLETFLDRYRVQDGEEREALETIMIDMFHFRPRRPSRFLEPGETLNLGGLHVDVLATPGHTPGHLAFFFREPGALFLGDYDLTPFGPFYGELHSTLEDVRASVEMLSRIEAKVWLTCHETGVFTSPPPPEVWRDYLAVIDQRDQALLKVLEKPLTLEEIVHTWIVYKKPREPLPLYRFAERLVIGLNLRSLVDRGLVLEENGRFRAA